jgi:hypothetical protein
VVRKAALIAVAACPVLGEVGARRLFLGFLRLRALLLLLLLLLVPPLRAVLRRRHLLLL